MATPVHRFLLSPCVNAHPRAIRLTRKRGKTRGLQKITGRTRTRPRLVVQVRSGYKITSLLSDIVFATVVPDCRWYECCSVPLMSGRVVEEAAVFWTVMVCFGLFSILRIIPTLRIGLPSRHRKCTRTQGHMLNTRWSLFQAMKTANCCVQVAVCSKFHVTIFWRVLDMCSCRHIRHN